MNNFKVISTAACTLVLVSQLHFTQCSDIHRGPLTAATPARFSAPKSPRPTSHSTGVSVRFPTQQTKAYATALADLLRTIVSSNEFREGSTAMQHLLAVLRPLFRAVGIVPPVSQKIEDDTTTTTTATTTTTTTTMTDPTTASSPQSATCPPTDNGSSRKKLMALFVPKSAVPSSPPTTSPPSTGALPKLFRKADSYIANR